MSVDIPEPLAELVRRRVAERGFPSASESIATLIRSDDIEEWWGEARGASVRRAEGSC